MFNSIFTNWGVTTPIVIVVMIAAILMGCMISLYYTKQNRTTRSFAYTLAFLPLITATIIMVVNGNLGAGIAVAGSFSLIRFRSIQGSGQEILAIFLVFVIWMFRTALKLVKKTSAADSPLMRSYVADVSDEFDAGGRGRF